MRAVVDAVVLAVCVAAWGHADTVAVTVLEAVNGNCRGSNADSRRSEPGQEIATRGINIWVQVKR